MSFVVVLLVTATQVFPRSEESDPERPKEQATDFDELVKEVSSGDQREIVEFFRQFTPFVHRLAPDKPVMLAPNCFHLQGAEETYKQLLPNLDIICPFGYHRMPAGDLTGEEAAALMQSLCDAAGAHLWMDLESFVFRNGSELHPRPIAGLISDFTRFPSFEKTLHYQFPGLMSAPTMSRRPGGDASVRLYLDYREYLRAGSAGGSRTTVRP